MNRIAIIILGCACSLYAQTGTMRPVPSAAQIGRYQLFSESSVPGFIFLLDTSTGRIWKMQRVEQLPGNPVVWEPQLRFETYDEEKVWFEKQLKAVEKIREH